MRPSPNWLLGLALVPGLASATETRLTGQMQVQGRYLESAEQSDGWTLQSAHSWLGLEAIEVANSTRYIAVAQADVDPLADSAGARQFYLGLQQSRYQVRAGRAATVEQRYLAEPVSLMRADGNGASAVSQQFEAFADRLLQVDFNSREAGFFAAEWQLTEAGAEDALAAWALVTGLDTSEGQVSLSYRQDTLADSGRWGASLRWQDGPWTLTSATLYSDEPLAWDVGLSYRSGTVLSKFAYGQDNNLDQDYWALGFEQQFSAAVRNFYELRWQPDDERWLGQAGFQLTF